VVGGISLLKTVLSSCGSYRTSYSMDNGRIFHECNAAGAWSWKLMSRNSICKCTSLPQMS